MASLNRVLLMGNVTRDPELRYTTSGLAVTQLGLAVNRRYKTKEGEVKEDTTFLDIDVFARQAETACQYLKKGSAVFIEGRLRLDKYETREGEKRSKLVVVADRVQFLGRKSVSADDATVPAGVTAGTADAEVLPDDDVPF